MMDEVIKDMMEERLAQLHTCLVCKVISTSPLQVRPKGTRRYRNGKTDQYPVIAVRVLTGWTGATLNLNPGDEVVVVFAERPIDGTGGRRHDLQDGIVLGRL